MNKLTYILVAVIVVAGGIYYGTAQRNDKPDRPMVASGHPEWQPIMFQSGSEIKGAGPALVKMIFDELGMQTEFPYKGAWDEVQAKARSGEVDSLVAAYKTDE